MSGCLDACANIRLALPCIDAWEEQRNSFVSFLSGTLFALGWWLVIDATSAVADFSNNAFWVCGVVSTLALFMVNSISNRLLFEGGDSTCIGPCGARIWMFLSFGLMFAGLISSCWIMANEYIIYNQHAPASAERNLWPGVACFLQNVCIGISTILFKFCRRDDLD